MALTISSNLKLPADQYFPNVNNKTGICLHHTVGGSAASSVDWWKRDKQMVGTAFIIDRDGTVYQMFDPAGWAYQFGLKWKDPDRIIFEKRFIGIELASEGGLLESGGNLYCFDTISPRTLKARTEVYDNGQAYRGYRYFDKYEPKQIDSVVQLVNQLTQTFNIEKKIPRNYTAFYGQQLKDFKGIIGHVNIREDKSDPLPDNSFWQRVINECGLQLVDVTATSPGLPSAEAPAGLTSDQVQKLFQDNVAQFSKMNRSAGNMVKGLLWELQDGGRNTYIRLKDAVQDGHIIFYELVQGDPKLIALAAQSLGFKSWENNRLEVHDA
ncbi:MAG: N-acetylmuramoyl-L-alanine amidase [Ignavibacteriales bacterium]|nr:N-acetylmuramoyl-L-alanine amidase [Ignavibacteriales bacterium]